MHLLAKPSEELNYNIQEVPANCQANCEALLKVDAEERCMSFLKSLAYGIKKRAGDTPEQSTYNISRTFVEDTEPKTQRVWRKVIKQYRLQRNLHPRV